MVSNKYKCYYNFSMEMVVSPCRKHYVKIFRHCLDKKFHEYKIPVFAKSLLRIVYRIVYA